MEALKHPLDNIVYEKQKNPKKVHEWITIKWEDIVPEPPSNSSSETQEELDHVFKASSLREVDGWGDIIKQVDNDSWEVFDDALFYSLSDSDRQTLKEMLNKAWPIVRDVVINLKRKFNRARPEQLRSDINPIITKTHQTPAYPSGHAAYGYTAAKIVSLVHPDLKEKTDITSRLVAYARVVQGVHYPSDSTASKLLVEALWNDINYKLFPEYFPASDWIKKRWRNTL